MTSIHAEIPQSIVSWIHDTVGTTEVEIERRSAGGSRAGYTVDGRLPDGETVELWLRRDTGVGPQSGGPYTLRREAAVYRQLHANGIKVAEVVAVHPTEDAFLMKRLYGRNWFSEVTDPDDQLRIAGQLMEELARLHQIEVSSLDLPELGPVRTIGEHVNAEIDIWEAQFRAYDDPEPTIELALAWLRQNVPSDEGWPLVLVQGDTGPGNFMFHEGELVAVTDWELAHFGDLHDDLAWIYVHDLQERFPDLPARLKEYAAASGNPVDPARLRYFLVLAQARCAIGTRAGMLAADNRGEIASHFIFTTLHTRALADALAVAIGVTELDVGELPDPGPSRQSWLFDIALEDMRTTVVPAISDGFASRRGKGVARLVKYLREQERLGAIHEQAEREVLGTLLAASVDDAYSARVDLCQRIHLGEVDHAAVVRYCVAHWSWRTQILRGAMGSLADRRYSPLPDA